jgi:hypothetical protein
MSAARRIQWHAHLQDNAEVSRRERIAVCHPAGVSATLAKDGGLHVDEPNEGDVALFLVNLLAAQLKAKGLIDVDQMEQATTAMLSRPISSKQKAAVEMAMHSIRGLKGIPPTQ